MKTEHQNMLPPKRVASLRQLYMLRLLVVATLLLVAAVVVHGIFLLPSYLSLRAKITEQNVALDRPSSMSLTVEQQEIEMRQKNVFEDFSRVLRLASAPKASVVIAALSTLPSGGITLNEFSFTREDERTGVLVLSGVATTRESLRSFEQALAKEPYIDSVRLPVSTYASEKDIAFSMTLVGSFLP